MCQLCQYTYKGFLNSCAGGVEQLDVDEIFEGLMNDKLDITKYVEELQNGSFTKNELQKLREVGYADYLIEIEAIAWENA